MCCSWIGSILHVLMTAWNSSPQTGAYRPYVGFDAVYVGKVGWRQSTHNLPRTDIGSILLIPIFIIEKLNNKFTMNTGTSKMKPHVIALSNGWISSVRSYPTDYSYWEVRRLCQLTLEPIRLLVLGYNGQDYVSAKHQNIQTSKEMLNEAAITLRESVIRRSSSGKFQS